MSRTSPNDRAIKGAPSNRENDKALKQCIAKAIARGRRQRPVQNISKKSTSEGSKQ